MRRVDLLAVGAVLSLSSVALAAPSPEPLPLVPSSAEAAPSSARSGRLLPEVLTVAGAGLVVPLASYVGITQGRSFGSFFAAFATSTLIGWVLAPLAVSLVHRWTGGEGGAWRVVWGTLAGLVLGALVGGPLATLPNQGYLAGLGLMWTMPAVGALTALEWGRGPASP